MSAPLLLQSLVEDVKLQAYKNLHGMELFNEGSFIGPPMLLSSLQAEMSNSRSVGQQNVNTLAASEGTQAVKAYFLFQVSVL